MTNAFSKDENMYSRGKIYKIVPINSECEKDTYYGSTCEPYLSRRMQGHKKQFNGWLKGKWYKLMSFELFQKYGVENCEIILVETYPCISKEELHAREKMYIKSNPCINRYVPLRSKKEYCADNVDKIKQYRINNCDKITERKKIKYLENRETILERLKQPHTCDCGTTGRYGDKARHFKSLKHQEYIQSIQSNQT